MDTWICLQNVIVHNPINPVSTAPKNSEERHACLDMSRPNSPGYGGFHSHGASPKWMAYFMEEIHWKMDDLQSMVSPISGNQLIIFRYLKCTLLLLYAIPCLTSPPCIPIYHRCCRGYEATRVEAEHDQDSKKKQDLHECLVMVIVGDIRWYNTRWCPSSLAKLVQISPISLWFIGDVSS